MPRKIQVRHYVSDQDPKEFIDKVERERKRLVISYDDVINNIDRFFADSPDKAVKEWFGYQVPQIRLRKADSTKSSQSIWQWFSVNLCEKFCQEKRLEQKVADLENFKLKSNMSASSFVSELARLCWEIDPKMPEERVVRKAWPRIPSCMRAIACTPSKTIEELIENLDGMLKDQEVNPWLKGAVTSSGSFTSQAPQLATSAVRALTSQGGCDYCNRSNHITIHCRDMHRDIANRQLDRLNALFEGRQVKGPLKGTNFNLPNSSHGTNPNISQGQQPQHQYNQRSNGRGRLQGGAAYQQYQNPPQPQDNFPPQQNYVQQQVQWWQQQDFPPQQWTEAPPNPPQQNNAQPNQTGRQPDWMNRGYAPRNQQQQANPTQQFTIQPHHPASSLIQKKISDLSTQVAGIQDNLHQPTIRRNDDGKTQPEARASSTHTGTLCPPPILPTLARIPDEVKKKEYPRNSSRKREVPPEHREHSRMQLRSLPKIRRADEESEPRSPDSGDSQSTQDEKLGREFLRLWNLSYQRKERTYLLRIMGYNMKLRSTVDTGSELATIAAATVYYMERHSPKSIKVFPHQDRSYGTICKDMSGTYNRSAILYFHLDFDPHRPLSYEFAIIEEMDSLLLLGENFNRRFLLDISTANNIIRFEGDAQTSHTDSQVSEEEFRLGEVSSPVARLPSSSLYSPDYDEQYIPSRLDRVKQTKTNHSRGDPNTNCPHQNPENRN
ncbi:unnamed protein product [Allacma fusca]|uniref:Uncharacterized protein n=1 Tax=Allacma fusca TaxID=39272 RepID=A0A8J2NRI7_9HEXA|nr:unnamed protein product [Allacma fusca]